MAIGNQPSLTGNVASKSISVTATAGQALFTVTGGYRINQISVFRNGVKLTENDYTARDGASVTLLSAATLGDTIEFQVFDDFRVADALDVNSGGTVNGNVNITGNLSVTGTTTLSAGSSVSFATTAFNLSGTASTATAAGTAYGLTGSPNITVGNVTGSAGTFNNNLNVGTAITIYSATGIISATKYYGDGSGLSGIDATRIASGLSSVTVASSSTISAYVNGSNIFNVTGTGVTMTSGKRLDVSSYSENVNFLGSVSGSTALDVGTYSVFVADISGSTSVTFTLSGAVSGRLSSATLILRFSGSVSRSVSLAFNPKYVGGAGPTYSTTAVTDIISFFTADAGTTTYVSVVGQGFA